MAKQPKRSSSERLEENGPTPDGLGENGSGAVDARDFERSLNEVETIVGELESGRLGLAEMLERYERGVLELRRCYEALEWTEQRIELLLSVGADGEARGQRFDHEALSMEEKRGARSARRGHGPSQPGGSPPSSGAGRGSEAGGRGASRRPASQQPDETDPASGGDFGDPGRRLF